MAQFINRDVEYDVIRRNQTMPEPHKNPADQYRPIRSNRTGEDIDMLNEFKSDPESSDESGSNSYKNDIDGA